jgi:hypothetical protein
MFDEMPQGYNIGWDIVDNRCVTTGAVPTFSLYDHYRLRFETIIWEWTGKERGGIIHMIVHPNKKVAEKVHGYIVSNLKKEEEK